VHGEIRKAHLLGAGLVTGIFFRPREEIFVKKMQGGAVELVSAGLSSLLAAASMEAPGPTDRTFQQHCISSCFDQHRMARAGGSDSG
jgi:hypothetical protein